MSCAYNGILLIVLFSVIESLYTATPAPEDDGKLSTFKPKVEFFNPIFNRVPHSERML